MSDSSATLRMRLANEETKQKTTKRTRRRIPKTRIRTVYQNIPPTKRNLQRSRKRALNTVVGYPMGRRTRRSQQPGNKYGDQKIRRDRGKDTKTSAEIKWIKKDALLGVEYGDRCDGDRAECERGGNSSGTANERARYSRRRTQTNRRQ